MAQLVLRIFQHNLWPNSGTQNSLSGFKDFQLLENQIQSNENDWKMQSKWLRCCLVIVKQ